MFFGFPFGTTHLTSHVGYISSDFIDGQVHKFQIDGSINPGNSGGPLLHISNEQVVGIVTRTQTGLESDFDQLVEAIKNNVAVLQRSRGMMSMAGVDPVEAMQATLNILAKVSFNLKRSANVALVLSSTKKENSNSCSSITHFLIALDMLTPLIN